MINTSPCGLSRRDQAGAVGSSEGWKISLVFLQLDFQGGLDRMQMKLARDHRPRRAESLLCLALWDKCSLHGRQESKPTFPSVDGF